MSPPDHQSVCYTATTSRHHPSRAQRLHYWLIALLCLLITGCEPGSEQAPIPIGVLHSLSGDMALSERSLVDAVQLAIDEINAAGGVLGHPLQAVVVDGKSDPRNFALQALNLINQHHVAAIFGCWTSACRKAVKPVVEHFDQLLFYPVQYEGLEQSANIIYTGAAPNQQIIPGVHWALEHLGMRFYLIGSDTIFPHSTNQIIRDLAEVQQCPVTGERYLPLESQQVEEIVDDIALLQPDVIFNTVNGSTNLTLFPALRADPRTAAIPVMSFSIAEPELAAIGPTAVDNHYATWNYFQSLDTPANRRFVTHFRQRFGNDVLIDDAMEASYIGVHLWAQAATDVGSIVPDAVRRAIGRQSLDAPEGIVSVDADNGHLWKTVRIDKAQANGQFSVVWSTDHPIRPEPFPGYRHHSEWLQLREQLAQPEHTP